jgi:hypothetical protein
MREQTEESEKVNAKTYKYCLDDFSHSEKQDSRGVLHQTNLILHSDM